MGQEIDRETFTEADYECFEQRLKRELAVLRMVLGREGFGVGPASVGVELELNLVDAAGRPLPRNVEVAQQAQDQRIALEVDRFNLEVNGSPQLLAGTPFRLLHDELTELVDLVGRAAAGSSGKVAMVGILPTLEPADLTSEVMTDQRRYRALNAGLRRLRREAFPVVIEGPEQLALAAEDVTFEGANTSLQVHLKLSPDRFARYYNAAQLATGPLLSACCNSPLLFGKHLWQETRVALFRQAVDDREGALTDDWRPARVTFGHGWVRHSAYELFAESVALHEPLLPLPGHEDAGAVLAAGGTPELSSLRLHHGTVWRWNRAVYDAALGGHLRVELRALPAGPTLLDMVANAAFAVGLVHGLERDLDALLSGMTFGHARRNFYEAARHGLAAELVWPSSTRGGPRLVPARELVERLLHVAASGLQLAGVDDAEARYWLEIVGARVRSGLTGAAWQSQWFERLRHRHSRRAAVAALFQRYQELAARDEPVHTWPST